jgi:hypothetical protein
MAAQTESVTNLFEQVFDNMKKTAETGMSMQQEMLRQLGARWPGVPLPQNVWLERVQKFQKEWAKVVSEVMTKHRRLLDEQYRMSIDSLKSAMHVADSSDPEDFRSHCEDLCRKSLDVMREASELQMKETQEALNKWIGLFSQAAS